MSEVMNNWKVTFDVLYDGGVVICFDPQLPANRGTLVTAPLRCRYSADDAVTLAQRILKSHASASGAEIKNKKDDDSR
jgi:hypothetical protein